MRLTFAAILMACLLSSCGTMPFAPSEYPLRDGLIAPMPVKGVTQVSNQQPAIAPVIVYSYGGSKLQSDLHAITEVMVQQTIKELAKAGQQAEGTPKSIEIKVNYLQSRYIAFYWKSELKFEAKLGNGQVIAKTVPHTSGVLAQDLNGCIAESVMVLLNDPQLRAYLAE